jgi:pre-mRNA-processing factor 6
VFAELLSLFARSETLWLKAVALEKQHGSADSLHSMLAKSVQACPQSDTLWLMGAKEKWLSVRQRKMERWKGLLVDSRTV